MRVFRSLVGISVQQTLLHREFWIKFILNGVLPILIPLLIWREIGDFSGSETSYQWSFQQIQSYYLVVLFISTITQTEFHYEFSGLVHSGNLNQWLIRPLSFLDFAFSRIAARTLILIAPSLITIFALSALLHFQVSFSAPAALNILITLPFSIVLLSCISVIIGSISFWTIRTEGIFAAAMLVLHFLGGMMIPLPFLPLWIQKLSTFLPMQFALFLPAIAVSDPQSVSISYILFGQIAWVFVLLIICNFLWRKGISRYDAVGS